MTAEEIVRDAFRAGENRGIFMNSDSGHPCPNEDEYLEYNLFETLDYAKQQSIAFFQWYGVKMVGFIEYITKVKPIATSEEIEEKIMEFEGQSFENLYSLFLEAQNKQS